MTATAKATATILLAWAALTASAQAEREPARPSKQLAKARRAEAQRLERELEYVTLRAREDLHARGPRPAAHAIVELEDGSRYALEDATIVFEKLGAVRVEQLRLRKGRRLLVTLGPPGDVEVRVGFGFLSDDVRLEDRRLLVPIELGEHDTVTDGLRSILFLPGETPSAEDVEECLRRHPDHDERTSRLRCGLPPGSE